MVEFARRLSRQDHEETDIDRLIERSSFGTAAAHQLQTRTPAEARAAIRDRVAELSAPVTPAVAADDVHDLVRAAAEGDESAWDQLVGRFNGLVWTIARGHGLSSADASDVAQTTWLRLVADIDHVRDAEKLGAWLATTARRECLRLLRTADRVQPVRHLPDLPTPAEAGTDPELLTLGDERDALLQQALRQLSPGCQRLLSELMAAEPASYPEISRRLGIPIGSIGPTRARCLDRLRRQAALLGLDVAEAEIAAPPAWTSDPLPDRLSS